MPVKFSSNVPEALRQVKSATRNALNNMGEKAVELAQNLTPVDTGNLRASLTHQPEGEDAELVGTSQGSAPIKPPSYAPYVEFGTRRMRAQPFLRPAIENNVGIYKAIIEEAFRGIK